MSEMIIDYDVVTYMNLEGLTNRVRKMIALSENYDDANKVYWEPIGGIASCKTQTHGEFYAQAMVLKKHKK